MITLSHEEISEAVRRAIAEDVGAGDATTLATIPATAKASARIVARESLVVCGAQFVEAAFSELSDALKLDFAASDALLLAEGATILRVAGPARAILTAERVALNFMQRLSGIATLTAQFVEAVKGTRAQILDTRKTTPGWRRFEKYAVACGGGTNHRFGLYDMILIKDNHLAALRDAQPNPVAGAVRSARAQYPALKVEVEADNLEQVSQALEAGADLVLLDNMSLEKMCAAVSLNEGRAKLEASGGVNLSTVRAIAETGVDFISVGALTHSARAMDIALDFES